MPKEIPKGIYCHETRNGKTYVCPYWSLNELYNEQESGYCSYIQRGDWMDKSFGTLWDQCKECSINDDDWEQEINEQKT